MNNLTRRVFMAPEGDGVGPGAAAADPAAPAAPLSPAPAAEAAPPAGRVLPLHAEGAVNTPAAPAAAAPPAATTPDPFDDLRAMLTPAAPAAAAPPVPSSAPAAPPAPSSGLTPEMTRALVQAGWQPPAPAQSEVPEEQQGTEQGAEASLAARLAALEAREQAAATARFEASNERTIQTEVLSLVSTMAGRLPEAQQRAVGAVVVRNALRAYKAGEMSGDGDDAKATAAMKQIIAAEIRDAMEARLAGVEMSRAANAGVRTNAQAHTPIPPSASTAPVDTFESVLREKFGATRATMLPHQYHETMRELARRAG